MPGILWSEPDLIVKSAEKASKAGRMEIIPGIIYRASLPFLSSQFVKKYGSYLFRENRIACLSSSTKCRGLIHPALCNLKQ